MGYRKVFNPWVGYTIRSYNQIKQSVLLKLGTKVPELTDQSESNPLVLITSMFSGVAEMLGYYIDNAASEAFITTARRFSSMVKLVRLIDYRVKAASAASCDLTLTFKSSSVITPLVADYLIPAGTEFSTNNGISFISLENITALTGATTVTVPVSQRTLDGPVLVGTTNGLADQAISIGIDYVDSTAVVTVDATLYERVDTFGFSGPNDKHYKIEISLDKVAYIVFGDGTNGEIPTSGQDVVATVYRTLGTGGMVNAGTITTLVTALALPSGIDEIDVNNQLDTVAGLGYESLESIRRRAPLSIRTLDRAVTKKDYEDIAEMNTGVDSAAVFYECGKYVTIYIAPEGGGIAQQVLMDSTELFVNQRKMVTTFIQIRPAGISHVVLKVEVFAKFGLSGIITKSDVEQAILDEWGFEPSYINRPFRISDIIALIDNLEKVDYLNLQQIRMIPYARPFNHQQALDYEMLTVSGTTKVNWRIQYVLSTDDYRIYKDNVLLVTIDDSTPTLLDGIVNITINPGPYTNGMEWLFVTYPVDTNIEFDDYSVPIIELADLDITVIEQLTTV